MDRTAHPFWVMVNKEITDHVKSWRFIILIVLIAFTCLGSLYTALSNFGQAVKPNDPDGSFFFLKLFTLSDGTLPPFIIFICFLPQHRWYATGTHLGAQRPFCCCFFR